MPDEPAKKRQREQDTLAPRQQASLKSYQEILREEVSQADDELNRPAHGLLVSGTLAGIGVGFSLLLIATVLTVGGLPPGGIVERLLLANAYAVGFVLVILGRTDLFTEYTTIAILPVLVGKASLVALARLWGLVYLGNLIGALIFSVGIAAIGPALEIASGETFGRIAHDLIAPDRWTMLLSAVFAGWLMGLLSWLITAARDTISQILFVWIVAFTIGMGHLHHSIVGAVEMFAGYLASDVVSLADCAGFLLWATLGNSIGGAIFAIAIRYSVVVGQAR